MILTKSCFQLTPNPKLALFNVRLTIKLLRRYNCNWFDLRLFTSSFRIRTTESTAMSLSRFTTNISLKAWKASGVQMHRHHCSIYKLNYCTTEPLESSSGLVWAFSLSLTSASLAIWELTWALFHQPISRSLCAKQQDVKKLSFNSVYPWWRFNGFIYSWRKPS